MKCSRFEKAKGGTNVLYVSRAQSCLIVRTKRSLTIKLNSGHCRLSMGKVLSLKINVPPLISCTKQKKKSFLQVLAGQFVSVCF